MELRAGVFSWQFIYKAREMHRIRSLQLKTSKSTLHDGRGNLESKHS
jgi:hypothetical protein